jgi:hypothetical protein
MSLQSSSGTTLVAGSKDKKRKLGKENEQHSDLEDTLSADTLEVLTSRAPPSKIQCTADRSRYPIESKSIYLKVKRLLHKKISVAAHLKKVNESLDKGQFPNAMNFRCAPYGANGDMDYVTAWADITSRCKKDLTALYLDKLRSQYRDIKNEIQLNMLELEQILEED